MADAPPRPVLAVLLALAGGLLCTIPPRIPIPKGIGWASLLLLTFSAVAFLPASWFPQPAWRQAFLATAEIPLSLCATPQPWHTGQGIILLITGIIFSLYLLCQPVNGENHFRLAIAFTVGIGIYAALSIAAVETGWKHPWVTVGTFGFLPNRNHVGTLLVMGAIAGIGPLFEMISKRKLEFFLPLILAQGSILTALFLYCLTRASAPLLLTGYLLWIAGMAGRQISLRQTVLFLLLLSVGYGIFSNSNAPSRKRLSQSFSGQPESTMDLQASSLAFKTISPDDFTNTTPFDFRLLMYKDTLDLIAEQPIQGVGLGNYQYIFPQYRRTSIAENFALHSDSSWLLIAAESGLPALGTVAALLILCCLRLRGCSKYHSWGVRWSSAVAVFIFVIHSAFDIPAHRTASLLPALFLAGLAFRKPSIFSPLPSRLWPSRLLFTGFGIAWLIAAGWLAGFIPLPLSVPLIRPSEDVRQQIYFLHKLKRQPEALDTVQTALMKTPLAAGFYFQWGELEMDLTHIELKTERLFSLERLLEPCLVSTPLEQAEFWLRSSPNESLPLFKESMIRAIKQEKRGLTGKVKTTYEKIVQDTARSPELTQTIRILAGNDSGLILEWMKIATPNAFDKGMSDLLSTDPNLNQWQHSDRRQLLRFWHQRGNRTELMTQINQHPEWSKDAWPVIAADFAQDKNYQKAWSFAAGKIQLLPPVSDPLDPPVSQAITLYNNLKTPESAEMLVKVLFLKKEWNEVIKMTQHNPSSRTLRIASLAATKLNYWEQAWRLLVQAIRLEDPTFTPE